MSYDFHRANLRKMAGRADINLRAVSAHAFRTAAPHKCKKSGGRLADNLCYAMWNLQAANGTNDGLIPIAPMMTALPGRSADCSTPCRRACLSWCQMRYSAPSARFSPTRRPSTPSSWHGTTGAKTRPCSICSLSSTWRARLFSRPRWRTSSQPACPPTSIYSATPFSTTISAALAIRWNSSWAMAAAPWRRLSRRYCHSYHTPSGWRWRLWHRPALHASSTWRGASESRGTTLWRS